MQNIRIFIENEWKNANSCQTIYFTNFKEKNDKHVTYTKCEYYDNILNIHCTLSRENAVTCTYINNNIPIVDFSAVKIFFISTYSNYVEWIFAHEYQAWAYYDYLISNIPVKCYHSKNSTNILSNESIELPFNNILPNISFKIARLHNHSIYYEKNDGNHTQIRISDHEGYRNFYKSYFNTILTPICMTPLLSFPSLQNIETTNEDDMCHVCYNYKQNIKYSCGHTQICNYCSITLYNKDNKLICPLCKEFVYNIELL